jgi:hypothetical protein
MLFYVKRWVCNCYICKRTTALKETRQRILKPFPIFQRAWQDISMDFIMHLPDSYGYNAILVIVDRLAKMKHFIFCKGIYDFKEVARLYVKYI